MMQLSAHARNLLRGKQIFAKQDILDDLADRMSRGETQKEIAASLGISDAYLSDIKRGSRGFSALSVEIAEKLKYEVVVLYAKKEGVQ